MATTTAITSAEAQTQLNAAQDALAAAEQNLAAASTTNEETTARFHAGDPDLDANEVTAAQLAVNRATRIRDQAAAAVRPAQTDLTAARRAEAEAAARALAASGGYQRTVEAEAAMEAEIAAARVRYEQTRATWDGQVLAASRQLTAAGGFTFGDTREHRTRGHWGRYPADQCIQALEEEREQVAAAVPAVRVLHAGFVVDGQVFTTANVEADVPASRLRPDPRVTGEHTPGELAAVLADLDRKIRDRRAALDREIPNRHIWGIPDPICTPRAVTVPARVTPRPAYSDHPDDRRSVRLAAESPALVEDQRRMQEAVQREWAAGARI